MNHFQKIVLSLLLIFSLACADAQTQKIDSLRKYIPHFELSFGQSLLFISNTQLTNLRNQASIIVPTSAILFFVEFRPEKRIKIPTFFNLPTDKKQYFINGQSIYERASPTFGAGAEFKVFQFDLDDRSNISFEVGPLASVIFNNRNHLKVAPLIAGRFRIKRGENFVMYFGLSYSFVINALGLLYGTGTIF